ncbi:MAG: ATP-binding cassette domain-containing protein [Nitrosopumilaceae archaeon]|nr:ATP-binding cassette domain-containing protein [Nitrosopumilaceae archaeon]
MEPGTKLQLEQISVSNKETGLDILDGIDLRVDAGDFVCFVGPSGCGKTTLLKTIAGFIHPTAGRVMLRDADGGALDVTGKIDSSRLLVFQDHALFPWLTVRGNMEFGLKMQGAGRVEMTAKVTQNIDMVSMTGFEDYNIGQISTGQRARIAIARALAMSPDVMLMDEPFAALDAVTTESLQDALRLLWLRTRKTILFITHDIYEACMLGTKIVVMGRRPSTILRVFESPREELRTREDVADMALEIRELLRPKRSPTD